MKRLLLFVALLAMSATASFGQTHRVLVEEFTGSWCGWCPRGALALKQMEEHYPGKAIGVAVHNGDPMAFPQADSITSGIGWPQEARFPGYPDGWVTRVLNGGGGSVWYSDPTDWIDTANWATGIVDQSVLENAKATIALSNVQFNPTTGMVTATLKAHFVQSMSGDLRFNVIVSEDKVSGPAGSTYDQHNYYYHRSGMQQSPYYNLGTGAAGNGIIANFVHNHVYRGSMAGIYGGGGIIPSSVTSGQDVTTTFSFRLPTSVQDPNNVKLVAIVNQYSATDATKNEVFDAEEKPLSTTPIKIVTADYTFNPQAGYDPTTHETFVTALSNGDSSQIISIFNAGDKPVRFALTLDQSKLPAGWTYSIDSQFITVSEFSSASATLTIHAPTQANFVVGTLQLTPVAADAWGHTDLYPVYALSSNTKNVVLWYSYPEVAALNGMPAALAPNTAVVPLSTSVIANYPITDMDLAVIGTPVIDNNNSYFAFSNPLQVIETMLQNGKKVLLTTDLGLYYALDPASAASNSEDGAAFFQDTLGLTYRSLVQHVSGNSYTSFKVTATNDPIGKGLTSTANASGTIQPQQYSSSFDVDTSKSKKLFYFDNTVANNAGIRYENSVGGRLVFFGFKLNALASQTNAQKIATNAINWLMAPPSSVSDPKVDEVGMFATANPFIGKTEIRYTPTGNEANVTFAAYDVLGNQVASMPSNFTNGAYTTTFDASNLAAGTYTVIARTATGAHQVRVVAK
jgi:thiol-disulfide isomerase/thioredoxin